MMYCRACRRRFYVGSPLYRWVSGGLLLMAAITPGFAYDIFKQAWSFLKKRDPRFSRSWLSKLFGRLSDSE